MHVPFVRPSKDQQLPPQVCNPSSPSSSSPFPPLLLLVHLQRRTPNCGVSRATARVLALSGCRYFRKGGKEGGREGGRGGDGGEHSPMADEAGLKGHRLDLVGEGVSEGGRC
jgi:hypothetical protein